MNMRLVMNIQLLFLLWDHVNLPAYTFTTWCNQEISTIRTMGQIYFFYLYFTHSWAFRYGDTQWTKTKEDLCYRSLLPLRSIWGFGGTHFSPVLFYQRPWRHPLSYLGKGKREVILSIMRQKGSTSDLVQTISKVPSTLKILNLLPDLVTAQISWVELLPLNLTLNTNLNHVREWARRKLASPYPSLLIFISLLSPILIDFFS